MDVNIIKALKVYALVTLNRNKSLLHFIENNCYNNKEHFMARLHWLIHFV